MYAKFALNYSGTIDRMIKMTEDFMQNKAKNRRKIHKNEEVKN